MGFFLRKRIKLGKGLSLNLSKSGLGLSFGVKGFRISKNSRGTQLNVGCNGMYYRKSLNSKKNTEEQEPVECEEYIEEQPQEELQEVVTIEISKELNNFKIKETASIFVGFVGFILIFFNAIAGLLTITGCIIYNKKLKNKYPELAKNSKEVDEIMQNAIANKSKTQLKVVDEPRENTVIESNEAKERRLKSKYQDYNYSHERYNKE